MTKKKKIIILTSMVALLAITAVFNFILTNDSIGITEPVAQTSANYFEQYRTERLSSRNEELLQLDNIIASSENMPDELSTALTMKTSLTKITEQEMYLENLIKAYGFPDTVVCIGLETNNINVITKTESLSADDAILIYTIIQEECNISPENVKIIPIS